MTQIYAEGMLQKWTTGYIEYKGSIRWYNEKVSAYGGNFILRECTCQFSRKKTRYEERISLSSFISIHGCPNLAFTK